MENPPGRPIVSAIKGPLERSGKYIDCLIKGLVELLPSYVQDTGDVLNKILDLAVPREALLVGIDVESLYTSIPHEWGTLVVYHFLDQRFPNMGAPMRNHGHRRMPVSTSDGGRRRWSMLRGFSTSTMCSWYGQAPVRNSRSSWTNWDSIHVTYG